MRDIIILNVQARVFRWVGLAWLITGLALGHDPLVVAFRAAGGALAAMLATGFLLRWAASTMAVAEPAGEGDDGA